MKLLKKFNLLFVGIFCITQLSCGDSPTSSDFGTLKISLTDAPADFEEVNITFSDIRVRIGNEWITVRGEPIIANLLEWNNGKSIVLGTADVPAGNYTQIRLIIEDAEVKVDGQIHKLFVPSGAKTGLKLGYEFTVNAGFTSELIIDFDATRSVVVTGPPDDPNEFILKPTLRVISSAITGSISGTVTNPENIPIAYAIVGR